VKIFNEQKKESKGRLEVVCGSMFSGKTEELMRRLHRAEIAKQKVLTMKHQIDKRYNAVPTCIVSHEGRERFAFIVGEQDGGASKILDLACEDISVVGIDEVQFFSLDIINVINELVERGKRVIVAGLDLDFRGEPWPVMSVLLSLADEVLKLKAICVVCGRDAYHTQRIVNSQPASYQEPVVVVGATEKYEARCRDCYIINDKPADYSFSSIINKKNETLETL
jgi:thymidine kinase